jgi:hypothetical protein
MAPSRAQGGFVADWIALLDEAREVVAAMAPGPHRRTRHGTGRREGQPGQPAQLPLRAAKEASGELTLRGAFFAISDGVLHILDEDSGSFAPRLIPIRPKTKKRGRLSAPFSCPEGAGLLARRLGGGMGQPQQRHGRATPSTAASSLAPANRPHRTGQCQTRVDQSLVHARRVSASL